MILGCHNVPASWYHIDLVLNQYLHWYQVLEPCSLSYMKIFSSHSVYNLIYGSGLSPHYGLCIWLLVLQAVWFCVKQYFTYHATAMLMPFLVLNMLPVINKSLVYKFCSLQLGILLFVCLVLAGAWFGYWAVRKLVLTEDGLVDSGVAYFVEWAIYILSAVMILQVLLWFSTFLFFNSSFQPIIYYFELSFIFLSLSMLLCHFQVDDPDLGIFSLFLSELSGHPFCCCGACISYHSFSNSKDTWEVKISTSIAQVLCCIFFKSQYFKNIIWYFFWTITD